MFLGLGVWLVACKANLPMNFLRCYFSNDAVLFVFLILWREQTIIEEIIASHYFNFYRKNVLLSEHYNLY